MGVLGSMGRVGGAGCVRFGWLGHLMGLGNRGWDGLEMRHAAFSFLMPRILALTSAEISSASRMMVGSCIPLGPER